MCLHWDWAQIQWRTIVFLVNRKNSLCLNHVFKFHNGLGIYPIISSKLGYKLLSCFGKCLMVSDAAQVWWDWITRTVLFENVRTVFSKQNARTKRTLFNGSVENSWGMNHRWLQIESIVDADAFICESYNFYSFTDDGCFYWVFQSRSQRFLRNVLLCF